MRALEPLTVKVDELAVEEQAPCITVQDIESSLEPAGESSTSVVHFLLPDLLVLGSRDFFLLSNKYKTGFNHLYKTCKTGFDHIFKP